MHADRFRNAARYWRTPLVPDADMVTAEYYDHEFSPHWHDAYTVPVIEAGAECFDYRGAHHVAEAGSVPVINPGEVHTGARAVDAGWRYRVFYLPVPLVENLARDMSGRPESSPWFPDEIIRDPDLARRLLVAHRLLENGVDPLAAELALVDAVTTLLGRHALERPGIAPLAADAHRVAKIEIPPRRRSSRTDHARRTRADGRSLDLPRRAPLHARNRSRAARVAQSGPHRARAAGVARRRVRDRCRGGERLHGSESLHASFQANVRRAARPLALIAGTRWESARTYKHVGRRFAYPRFHRRKS
jgi:hypothetical protein